MGPRIYDIQKVSYPNKNFVKLELPRTKHYVFILQ